MFRIFTRSADLNCLAKFSLSSQGEFSSKLFFFSSFSKTIWYSTGVEATKIPGNSLDGSGKVETELKFQSQDKSNMKYCYVVESLLTIKMKLSKEMLFVKWFEQWADLRMIANTCKLLWLSFLESFDGEFTTLGSFAIKS